MGELKIFLGALVVFIALVMDIPSRLFRYGILLAFAVGAAYLYTLISADVIAPR